MDCRSLDRSNRVITMYENAEYIRRPDGEAVMIRVKISGLNCFVPLDPANVDYQNIMRLVEEGTLTISDGNNE